MIAIIKRYWWTAVVVVVLVYVFKPGWLQFKNGGGKLGGPVGGPNTSQPLTSAGTGGEF